MNILVTYQSKTGFTKKYAEWISERLGCDLKEISQVGLTDINKCELVIHGGWIMGGMINGLDKIRKLSPKHLIAFGVGITIKNQAYFAKCISANKLDDTPFFYYEGGIDPDKMGFIGRTMVKIATKKTPEYTDHTDKNEIEELVKLALSYDQK